MGRQTAADRAARAHKERSMLDCRKRVSHTDAQQQHATEVRSHNVQASKQASTHVNAIQPTLLQQMRRRCWAPYCSLSLPIGALQRSAQQQPFLQPTQLMTCTMPAHTLHQGAASEAQNMHANVSKCTPSQCVKPCVRKHSTMLHNILQLSYAACPCPVCIASCCCFCNTRGEWVLAGPCRTAICPLGQQKHSQHTLHASIAVCTASHCMLRMRVCY
jgi:hypothetical protein